MIGKTLFIFSIVLVSAISDKKIVNSERRGEEGGSYGFSPDSGYDGSRNSNFQEKYFNGYPYRPGVDYSGYPSNLNQPGGSYPPYQNRPEGVYSGYPPYSYLNRPGGNYPGERYPSYSNQLGNSYPNQLGGRYPPYPSQLAGIYTSYPNQLGGGYPTYLPYLSQSNYSPKPKQPVGGYYESQSGSGFRFPDQPSSAEIRPNYSRPPPEGNYQEYVRPVGSLPLPPYYGRRTSDYSKH